MLPSYCARAGAPLMHASPRRTSRPPCPSLGVEAPFEPAAAVPGILHPVALAPCAPVSEASRRRGRTLALPAHAVRPLTPATMPHRCAALPPRFPRLATPSPAACPSPRRYPRTPATSRGLNYLPLPFRDSRLKPGRRVRLSPPYAAMLVVPRGQSCHRFLSYRRSRTGLRQQFETP